MAIKQHLDFSKKKHIIQEFEDLGEYDRISVPAKQALILMIRGLYSDWKLPITYYFSENGVKAEMLKKYYQKFETFSKLRFKNSGYCKWSIYLKSKTYELKIEPEKPFFFRNYKYYALSVPHFMKSVRNNLISRDVLNQNDKKIAWDSIRQIDKQSIELEELCFV